MADAVRINVMLKVYKHESKNQCSMFSLKEVPIFKNVQEFKSYLVKKHAEEISPAKDISSFDLGYYGTRGRKLTICTEEHLREAYLAESLNYVTFWLKPHTHFEKTSLPKKRETVDEDEVMCLDFKASKNKKKKNDSVEEDKCLFNNYLSRLRETHGSVLSDFKLKCWARMLVNGSHRDDTVPPNAAFFALESTGAVPSTSNMTPIVTTTSTSSSTSLQSARTQVDSAIESNETKV
ncbi:uncharacterized protein LOC116290402 [Actinia tenebrosa]|uniref:Uncharacterized protein LOC116290402 n=1 Tax=Actinia tenebrosa TaxID=6105 RepID=A0A6P8HA10_ACTTE|nr:uncharacterized protein LOC116290402 [Actinia tenebrosa]